MQRADSQGMIDVETHRHFIRAMWKLIDGRSVTQPERTLLNEVFEALLRGEDVSELIGIKPAHNRRSADPVYIALHYLCLRKLMHETAEVAWRMVGDAWGLKKSEVQWVIANNRAPALSMLRQYVAAPETLLRLCERHARGVRPGRRRSGFDPRTQSIGDTRSAT